MGITDEPGDDTPREPGVPEQDADLGHTGVPDKPYDAPARASRSVRLPMPRHHVRTGWRVVKKIGASQAALGKKGWRAVKKGRRRVYISLFRQGDVYYPFGRRVPYRGTDDDNDDNGMNPTVRVVFYPIDDGPPTEASDDAATALLMKRREEWEASRAQES